MINESMQARDVAIHPPLRWPPPGLEPIQGSAWNIITLLAAGGVILTVPMLWSVASTHPFWSTGAFGASWWILLVTSVLGVVLIIGAFDRAARLLFRGAKAARLGYDWNTIALVASDSEHDAGFLLQGLRHYTLLEERERRLLMRMRVIAVMCYAGSLVWLPLSLAIGLVLAGHGRIASGRALFLFVVLPSVLVMLAGLAARAVEGAATAQSRRKWRTDPAADAALSRQVAAWQDARAEQAGDTVVPVGAATKPARALAFVLVALCVLLPIPILTVATVSAIGPFIAMIAAPNFSRTAERMVLLGQYRHLVLPADSSITPMEAGELLNVLSFAGKPAVPPGGGLRDPVRYHPEPWPTATERPAAFANEHAEVFSDRFATVGSLTAEERAFLERLAAHRAHLEFARLARAPRADLTGGRLVMDSLRAMSLFEVPIMKFGAVRETARYHVAKALLEASRGDVVQAETTLREIVSVGSLISNEASMLIDMLVGTMIANVGATALEKFYVANGRIAAADSIRIPMEVFALLTKAGDGMETRRGNPDGLRASMSIAGNRNMPRGIRWEALHTLQMGSGCLNPNAAVFGRDDEYLRWLARMRTDLVRYPAEQELFEVIVRGFAEEQTAGSNAVGRLVGLTLGKTGSANSCATLMSGLSSMM